MLNKIFFRARVLSLFPFSSVCHQVVWKTLSYTWPFCYWWKLTITVVIWRTFGSSRLTNSFTTVNMSYGIGPARVCCSSAPCYMWWHESIIWPLLLFVTMIHVCVTCIQPSVWYTSRTQIETCQWTTVLVDGQTACFDVKHHQQTCFLGPNIVSYALFILIFACKLNLFAISFRMHGWYKGTVIWFVCCFVYVV